jgi:hypothetical protein
MTNPATRRINRGNNHTYLLDGEKCDGVTWLLGEGVPKGALAPWAAKTVAEYVADRLQFQTDDENADVCDATRLLIDLEQRAQKNRKRFRRDSRVDVVEQLKGVMWDDRDQAANKGTAVHTLAEHISRGETVDVPPYLVGHVDSYIKFLDEFNPDFVLLEATVISRRWRYMGTLDIIADFNGERWLLDIKTSRSGIFGNMALQLALYRNAETYLDDQGEEQPMPTVDHCGFLWVRADGYDLKPATVDEKVYRTALYAAEMARFLQRDDIILDSLTPERTAS